MNLVAPLATGPPVVDPEGLPLLDPVYHTEFEKLFGPVLHRGTGSFFVYPLRRMVIVISVSLNSVKKMDR